MRGKRCSSHVAAMSSSRLESAPGLAVIVRMELPQNRLRRTRTEKRHTGSNTRRYRLARVVRRRSCISHSTTREASRDASRGGRGRRPREGMRAALAPSLGALLCAIDRLRPAGKIPQLGVERRAVDGAGRAWGWAGVRDVRRWRRWGHRIGSGLAAWPRDEKQRCGDVFHWMTSIDPAHVTAPAMKRGVSVAVPLFPQLVPHEFASRSPASEKPYTQFA